ncbi:MAG TPA: carboxylesterase/lipase family protein [Thermoanaerobaculia bacterium]|nr:carboxylesterase/lipase family protein [Thermoanaerobaculia bacterium]
MIDRRNLLATRPPLARFLATAGLGCALLLLTGLVLTGCGATEATASGDADASAGEPIAATEYGQVRGEIVDGIYAFRGIPYGGSTAGENRFKPPTEPEPWTGVRDAIEYGDRAPQTVASGDSVSDYARLIRWSEHPGEISEDCLVLNVWTPGLDDSARPVMVSFHGGGFTSGSGNGHGYVGDPLARYGDVVVVTVNHRLGAFGYLHLADLGGPEYAHSGNAGMLDLVAALEWVRDNITGFGGDPGNVMIWGQSGGGAKTSTLLAMPAAKGLFHRAAVQSGSSLTMRTPEQATDAAEALLAELGIDAGQLEKLREVPYADVVAAQAKVGAGRGFAPVVDGEVLPRHPFEPDAPEISRDVPMIIGFTLDDAALSLTNFDLDEAGLADAVRRLTGDRTDEILAAYREAYPDAPPYLVQSRIVTDSRFGRGALLQAERKAQQGGAPAYLYLWTWESPGMDGKFGAVHGVDVGLAFHNSSGEIAGADSEEGRLMADRLASAWVAFARTGNPNNPELPEWPAYDPETRPTMIFDVDTRVEEDPLAGLREFWEEGS